MKRAAAFWIAVLVAGCASAPPAPAKQAEPAVVPSAARTLPNDLKWVRDSAEYHALVIQAYSAATAYIEQQASSRRRGAWAVVLDADETIISNFPYQLERARLGQGYSAESWNVWVKRREATPLPGAARFLSRVRELGGRIAIVTNRLGSECGDTEAVFRAHMLVYDVMLCRPDGTPSDKNPRFASVATGQAFGLPSPVDVVAFVGDNILDFPGLSQQLRKSGDAGFSAFGGRFFILPNPMYGSWQ